MQISQLPTQLPLIPDRLVTTHEWTHEYDTLWEVDTLVVTSYDTHTYAAVADALEAARLLSTAGAVAVVRVGERLGIASLKLEQFRSAWGRDNVFEDVAHLPTDRAETADWELLDPRLVAVVEGALTWQPPRVAATATP